MKLQIFFRNQRAKINLKNDKRNKLKNLRAVDWLICRFNISSFVAPEFFQK